MRTAHSSASHPTRRHGRRSCAFRVAAALSALVGLSGFGQSPAATPQIPPAQGSLMQGPLAQEKSAPIAFVKMDPSSGLTLSGSLTISGTRASIGSSGSVTAGSRTARLTLPGRGQLRLCATTQATLTMDPVHAASDHSGLMISLQHGALETDFRTGSDSDVILTPDFRILISGPGKSAVQVRLGDHGDTCVDNPGKNPPYVTVSSLFTGAAYRVRSQQRVLFQHGSITEVVDNESESCGCPASPTRTLGNNAFPVAQSAGLAPLPAPPPNATVPGVVHAEASASLSYSGTSSATAAALHPSAANPPQADTATASAAPAAAAKSASKPTRQKPGVLRRIGHFFHHWFRRS